MGEKTLNELETQRLELLAEVDRLKAQYDRLMRAFGGVPGAYIPVLGGGGGYALSSSTVIGMSLGQKRPDPPPITSQTELAEIKVWRRDGRVETIRCELGELQILDRSGVQINLDNQNRRAVKQGDRISLTARAIPWKFGPDRRPNRG